LAESVDPSLPQQHVGAQKSAGILNQVNHQREDGSMQSNIATAAALTLSAAFAFGAPALSADLPQAGSFTTHSANKAIGQSVQVGDKHSIGSGTVWAVTYNDAGSGPLHMGSMVCNGRSRT
jgi:hypothetical protein